MRVGYAQEKRSTTTPLVLVVVRMKVPLRILLAIVALPIAYWAGIYVERYTLAPLATGGFEGTPATVVAFFSVFFSTLVVVLVLGNILLPAEKVGLVNKLCGEDSGDTGEIVGYRDVSPR
jgi:hypothetical protein